MKLHGSSALVAVAAAVALGFVIGPWPARLGAAEDAVLRGDAKCTRCHEENESVPAFAIGKTRHGVIADQRTPTCTSCHGESDTHINKPEGVDERPKPGKTFGKTSPTPIAERNDVCLTCHQNGPRTHWLTSMHAARDI